MGILRADRITGLGGANAIKGSVKFTGDGSSGTGKGVSLNITGSDKDDLNFAGNNFTFEAWVFPTANIAFNPVYCQAWGLQIYIDTTSDDNNVKVYVASSDTSSYAIGGATSANGTIKPDAWNHVAFSRSGNSWTIFTNGTAATSSTSSQSLVSSNADYTIGIFNSIGSGNDLGSYFGFNGYISNLRIRTGDHYLPSTNFTPPVGELQKTSDTVLLCCQSSASSIKEETGKTLVPTRKNTNDKLPTASKFTPNSPIIGTTSGFSTTTDVGTQFGLTFDGVTTFDSQAYMVPSGGNTAERNRGRGLHAGGENPSHCNIIDFIQIQSGGNAFDFGDLITVSNSCDGVSSKTRAVFATYDAPTYNSLEFVTMATTGNATDFGDQTISTGQEGTLSNDTRGLFAGGYGGAAQVFINTVEFITIPTLGNAQDFGNLREAMVGVGGASDTTRGLFVGGFTPGAYRANIDQFTIATTGDATDFGDLSVARRNPAGTSDSTRGVFFGGNDSGGTNVIDFVTIQSAGNATDFGDSTSNQSNASGASDSIRGVFSAGYYGSPNLSNVIEKVIIQTTGNSVDYGDLIDERIQGGSVSDSHGGLE